MKASFFVFITGLVTTGFGVGGVESSITNGQLLMAAAVAIVGLSIMGCGVSLIQNDA